MEVERLREEIVYHLLLIPCPDFSRCYYLITKKRCDVYYEMQMIVQSYDPLLLGMCCWVSKVKAWPDILCWQHIKYSSLLAIQVSLTRSTHGLLVTTGFLTGLLSRWNSRQCKQETAYFAPRSCSIGHPFLFLDDLRGLVHGFPSHFQVEEQFDFQYLESLAQAKVKHISLTLFHALFSSPTLIIKFHNREKYPTLSLIYGI